MSTRLKMDFHGNSLEVEGEKEFVQQVYNDFKNRLDKDDFWQDKIDKTENSKKAAISKPSKSNTNSSKVKKKSSIKGDDLNIVKDLDLFPDNKMSLKEYVKKFNKPSSTEKYLIYVYYLKNELKIEKIKVDHIYTCIKHIGNKVPQYLSIALHNFKRDKGWIDTTDINNINYTTAGENHLSHDMEMTKVSS